MNVEDRWQARFRAPRMSLPVWARNNPSHTIYRSNVTGTWEIYAWDRCTTVTRRVTGRPNGTSIARLDPTGEWIWWFDDTDGDEFGVWMRQAFHGQNAESAEYIDELAVPGLDPAYPAGLALGATGLAIVGRATAEGTSVHRCRPGEPAESLYEHREDAHVVGMSRDETLIAINHSEHGDSRHMALRVLRQDGTAVAELLDGPGKGITGLRFSPISGDAQLLAIHERRARPEPLIWDPMTGHEREIWLDLPGEISADWFHDGRALLIVHGHRGRDELYRYDLAEGKLDRIETPRGVIAAATARPDGSVEYQWTCAAQPPVIRSTGSQVVVQPAGPVSPPSVPVEDADVTGPGGRIHALISKPSEGLTPFPTVFLVHGGPAAQDEDSFAPQVAAWVDHGFAVVRVNYRGSTGYGTAWRDALEERVGLTELEDLKAVRDWAVHSGLADPTRIVLAGGSWGGYLTLLGLGTQPSDWTLGIAAVPVADYPAAYEDEMEALRAFDRALFGGTPEEVPDRYRESSPLTYVDRVEAPVLILAGENDPRCPIRQIENYLERLAALGTVHAVYRYDAGHGSLVVEERIRQMAAELSFAQKHLDLSSEPA